jgi:hypothetical protein
MNVTRISRFALAYGSIAIGLAGVLAPRAIARLFGDNPDLARSLAIRDGIIGIALLRVPGIAPLAARSLADFDDAARLRERSPLVAAGAFATGLAAIAVAIASSTTTRRRRSEARQRVQARLTACQISSAAPSKDCQSLDD